ncbi:MULTISPECIES: DUF2892 domain-containing protein [unclassified Spirosoma]|uniref:YgaP family membrane protein n=1 Tax=unclassified Spirosoma TaxID=2621999 RepID=UPI000959DE39|nr:MULTISPECIES: DUF2892 domain-containing protein [unclassified Spirosoma]MBN8824205.1 DUF2892 domain-containing protein [Spirosoma sp.]OJW78940.1 MAG: hypothetical protein BGO59_10765 [Spirosoma sp. 48-14]
MKKNMGSADRIIRVIVAVVLIALFATNVLTGTWGMITLVVAGIFIATSLVSTCPLYLPFGIRTNRIRKHAN